MVELSRTSFRLAALPGALWRDYRRNARERAAMAALNRMSDGMLRDIGLDRGSIPDAVRTGVARRRAG